MPCIEFLFISSHVAAMPPQGKSWERRTEGCSISKGSCAAMRLSACIFTDGRELSAATNLKTSIHCGIRPGDARCSQVSSKALSMQILVCVAGLTELLANF